MKIFKSHFLFIILLKYVFTQNLQDFTIQQYRTAYCGCQIYKESDCQNECIWNETVCELEEMEELEKDGSDQGGDDGDDEGDSVDSIECSIAEEDSFSCWLYMEHQQPCKFEKDQCVPTTCSDLGEDCLLSPYCNFNETQECVMCFKMAYLVKSIIVLILLILL